MPNAGDKVELTLSNNSVNLVCYIGVFAGYDTVTENYIIEDCYNTQYPDYKSKKFFNRKYVVMIEYV